MGVDLKNRVRCFNDEFKAKVAQQKLGNRRVVRAVNRMIFNEGGKENSVAVFEYRGTVLYSLVAFKSSEDFELDALVWKMERTMRKFDELLFSREGGEEAARFISSSIILKDWERMDRDEVWMDEDRMKGFVLRFMEGFVSRSEDPSFLQVYAYCMDNFLDALASGEVEWV